MDLAALPETPAALAVQQVLPEERLLLLPRAAPEPRAVAGPSIPAATAEVVLLAAHHLHLTTKTGAITGLPVQAGLALAVEAEDRARISHIMVASAALGAPIVTVPTRAAPAVPPPLTQQAGKAAAGVAAPVMAAMAAMAGVALAAPPGLPEPAAVLAEEGVVVITAVTVPALLVTQVAPPSGGSNSF